MKKIFLIAALFISFATRAAESDLAKVFEPSKSPLISFRILFLTGSMFDPPGKEGLAALTASMIAKGGTRALPYEAITKAMYPMATSFDTEVDKEMTVFTSTTHLDNLDKYYDLIRQMLLEPGFRDEDFTRLKSDAINYLKVSLREGNDEELGKEQLYNLIYAGHPYGHENMGTLQGLESITIADIKGFYAKHFTRANLVLGLAGNFPSAFGDQVLKDLGTLPEGKKDAANLPQPKIPTDTQVQIIERETRSTAISIGFPIDVKRGDKDWPALMLVASFFGQHRSSNSHLYQRLREARGLNYGDYSYVEYYPHGGESTEPEPNLGRHQQIFQIWIRPVPPVQGHFALRGALFEFDKLVRDGLSESEFEETREFLTKFSAVLTQTQGDRLGYALDSKFYGIPEFNTYLKTELSKLTRAQVNEAIKKHLGGRPLRIVMVTKDAAHLRAALLKNDPSPITYNSPKPADLLTEDKIIEKFPIPLKPENVTVLPIDQVFEK